MPIPPTRYIDAGPGVPLANPQVAMMTGDAVARFGETIQHVGAVGFQVAEKVRKIEEAGKMSAFFSNLDEEASQFSNNLMTRSDTGAWPSDWKEKTMDMRERMKSLGLSPEGMAMAEREFGEWSTQRTIHFETQAATKALQMGRAQIAGSVDYYARRGDSETAKRELDRGLASGMFDPVEHEKALRSIEETATESALDFDIQDDPKEVLKRLEDHETFLKENPGATLDMIEQGKRKATHRAQELREAEADEFEEKMVTGKFKPEDLESARYLTEKDKRAVSNAWAQKDPPSREVHAKAWKLLENLRALREDPSVTPAMYREAWNEARGTVMGGIAPQWQGDIRKEMNYLSPAGRNPDGGGFERDTKEDLAALGRSMATRALEDGIFGPIEKDTPHKDKEKAYIRFEDVRDKIKRYVIANPNATREQVRDETRRIMGTKIDDEKSAPLIPTVPPEVSFDTRLNSVLGIPPGTGKDSSSVLLPPKPSK